MLKVYNSLSRQIEVFSPLNPDVVRMYVCGPTVYDYPHIGNARSIVVYDLLYRLLCQIYGAGNVTYVRNITDVDDKIIAKSQELGVSIQHVTGTTEGYFREMLEYLNCLSPSFEPKATLHIQEMIDVIQLLLDSNHAYLSDGHVYFDVASAKDYHILSRRDFSESLEAVRIDQEKNSSKKNYMDFVLWKPANSEDPPSSSFDSPWGLGRPGWHIECSAMSHKYLGSDFDIHGGGVDLIFPHHTNEIAQSTCAFKGSKFARYWVHNGFLTVDGQKMSKSLGNFITIPELIDKQVKGEATRLLLANTSYRKPLDFSYKSLDDATKTLNYWYRAIESLDYQELQSQAEAFNNSEVLDCLYDDLNVPMAITCLNKYAGLVHGVASSQEKVEHAVKLIAGARFLGLMQHSPEDWFHDGSDLDIEYIMQKIQERSIAKKDRNFALADEIRNALMDNGIMLEDKPDGTIWKKIP